VKVGDIVKYTLYDTEQVGAITKVHQESGWAGYVSLSTKGEKEILMPVSVLRLV
jgi:hypothetical protein